MAMAYLTIRVVENECYTNPNGTAITLRGVLSLVKIKLSRTFQVGESIARRRLSVAGKSLPNSTPKDIANRAGS